MLFRSAKRKSPPPTAKRQITPADPEWTTVKRPKQPTYRREVMSASDGQVQVVLSREEWIDPRLGGNLDRISAQAYTMLMEEYPPAPFQELSAPGQPTPPPEPLEPRPTTPTQPTIEVTIPPPSSPVIAPHERSRLPPGVREPTNWDEHMRFQRPVRDRPTRLSGPCPNTGLTECTGCDLHDYTKEQMAVVDDFFQRLAEADRKGLI